MTPTVTSPTFTTLSLTVTLIILLLSPISNIYASTSNITGTPSSSKIMPVKTAKKNHAQPTWNELTPAQQQALSPLASEWDKMEGHRKEKWLVISKKYASMEPAAQQRLQERMRDWVKLTPAQRRVARENYVRARKLDANKKSAQWKQYQQIPEEEKKKLAQTKPPKRAVALPAAPHKATPPLQLPVTPRESARTPALAPQPENQ